ncbi:MAG: hypothetical protein MI810_19695 [Flavobacteriales bacterium]|nr:hypothetical protein [Flavobacteriales bacterium]
MKKVIIIVAIVLAALIVLPILIGLTIPLFIFLFPIAAIREKRFKKEQKEHLEEKRFIYYSDQKKVSDLPKERVNA